MEILKLYKTVDEIVPAGFAKLYEVAETVSDYTSAVWTERSEGFGEVIIVTPIDSVVIDQLPLGTLVSHLETEEVMIITSSLETVDDDGYLNWTIKGTSASAILNERIIEAFFNKKRPMIRTYSLETCICVLLWNAVANDTGIDVSRGTELIGVDGDDPVAPFPGVSVKDKIPNVIVTDSTGTAGPTKDIFLEQGQLWPQLEKLLGREDIYIRTIRPGIAVPCESITVAANPLLDRGKVTRNSLDSTDKLRFDIYKGVDRATNTESNSTLIFDSLEGDLENVSHLVSIEKLKTTADIIASVNIKDYTPAQYANNVGFDRRVLAFNAGQPEYPKRPVGPDPLPQNPTQNQKDKYEEDRIQFRQDLADWRDRVANIKARFIADAEEDVKRALKKSRRLDMIAGQATTVANYKYGVDYYLGDKVLLRDRTGVVEPVFVTEYIRTDDAEGDRGYPTLTKPEKG